MGSAPCGPQKLDQTDRLPELRERTPLLWGTTGGYQNPCRTFAEVSYALLCTVMQFATDVTAKNNVNYEPGGRGFKSCRGRQYSMGYELQVRSFRGLRDPCGTFYPQNGLARVRDTQHGARFLTIRDQVRLLEQPTNIRTRVVAGHGMIGVAK